MTTAPMPPKIQQMQQQTSSKNRSISALSGLFVKSVLREYNANLKHEHTFHFLYNTHLIKSLKFFSSSHNVSIKRVPPSLTAWKSVSALREKYYGCSRKRKKLRIICKIFGLFNGRFSSTGFLLTFTDF